MLNINKESQLPNDGNISAATPPPQSFSMRLVCGAWGEKQNNYTHG